MNIEKYIINVNASLLEALKQINEIPDLLTLFVHDNTNKIIGSLTDGDIRRGLIKGLQLTDTLDNFLYHNFEFLEENKDNFDKLKIFRQRQLMAVPLLSENGELLKIYDFTKTKSILPIDAVIMAGGKGKRLHPLTLDTPKPLLKIGSKEIISYNFNRLHQFGINNQYITVNYLGEQIEAYCKNYNHDISFSIIKEQKFCGTAGALALIPSFKNDIVLLMNSDLLTNIDFEDLYKSFLEKKADMMVASVPYNIDLPYAILETNNRQVTSFKEKPKFTYYANAGIYLIKKELLSLIPKDKVYNATDLMDDVVAQGHMLMHYPIRSYWLDIGKHEDFEKAQKDIAHIDFD